MVQGDRNKGTKASSAKAAQLLGNAAAAQPVAVGFGGFAGSKQVAEAPTTLQDVPSSSISNLSTDAQAAIDSETLLHLKRLSKRDSTTKHKALQALRSIIPNRDASEWEAICPAWAKLFHRLVLDNSRAVRAEACRVQQALAESLKRRMAPVLKSVIGPWWLAQHDTASEVAASARDSFQAAFPENRHQEALTFCGPDLLDFLQEMMFATPEELGEVKAETPEERAERAERALTAALAGLAALTQALCNPPTIKRDASKSESHTDSDGSASGANAPEVMVAAAMDKILAKPGCLKRTAGSKVPSVRKASYQLFLTLCKSLPSVLETRTTEMAPFLLGAIGDKDPETHAVMWGLVLTFAKRFPAAWHAVDIRKAFLPRLQNLLRNGCFGSARASFPAVLLLLTLMPKSLMGPQPGVLIGVLDSIWKGWESVRLTAGSRAAAALSYQECLSHAFIQARAASGGSEETTEAYCRELLAASFSQVVVPAALSTADAAADNALSMVAGCLSSIGKQEPAANQLLSSLLIESMAAAAMKLLEQEASSGTILCTRVKHLLEKLLSLSSVKGASGPSNQHLAAKFGMPVAGALLPSVTSGHCSAEASNLLAALIDAFGTEVAATAAPAGRSGPHFARDDVADAPPADASAIRSSLLQGCMATELNSASAASNARLLLAFAMRSSDPAREFGSLVGTLLRCQAPAAAMEASAEGHAGSREPAAAQEASPADVAPNSRPHASQLLLAHALVEAVMEPSADQPSGSKWRSSELDAATRSLCSPSSVNACSSRSTLCAIITRLFAGGADHCLLSPAAQASILDQLLASLTTNPQQTEPSGEQESAAISSCSIVASIAQTGFPEHLMESAIELLKQVMQLSWSSTQLVQHQSGSQQTAGDSMQQNGSSDAEGMISEDDEELADAALEQVHLSEAEDEPSTVADAAARAWQGGHLALAATVHWSLELQHKACFALLGTISHAAAVSGASAQEGGDASDVHASRLQQLITAFPSQQDHILDDVLSQSSAEQQVSKGASISQLARSLLGYLGWSRLLCLPDSNMREDLTLQMLQDPGSSLDGGNIGTLQGFLVEHASRHPEGMDKMLTRLLRSAADSPQSMDSAAAALQQLLSELAQDDRTQPLTSAFFKANLSNAEGTLPDELLQGLLHVLAPQIRRVGVAEDTGLAALILHFVQAASSQPPALLMQGPENLHNLRCVVACLPVDEQQPAPEVTTNERSALLNLLSRQLTGGQAAIAAEAAERRFGGDSSKADGSRMARRDRAEAAVAALTRCTVHYASQDMDEGLWARLYKPMQAGLEKLSGAMDALSSSAVQSLVAGAAEMEPQAEVTPVFAAQYFMGLQRKGIRKGVQAIASRLLAGLEGVGEPASASPRLPSASAAWAATFKDLLRHDDALPDWQQVQDESQEHLLRSLFSCGTVQAAANALGGNAVQQVAAWRAGNAQLWKPVADSCRAVPAGILTAALEAFNRDKAARGMDATDALLALLLGPEVEDNLQPISWHLLLSATLLPKLTDADLSEGSREELADDEDDEEMQNSLATASRSDMLNRMGLRAWLVNGMVGLQPEQAAPARSSQGQDRSAVQMIHAWAILLAHLISLPPASLGSRHLAQSLGDVFDLVPQLLDALITLLPLPSTQPKSKRASTQQQLSPKPAASSAAAAAAAESRASGSQPSGRWSLADGLLQAGFLSSSSALKSRQEQLEGLARLLYRATLQALPASARSWFTDIKDKRLAASLEAYTAEQESPALLQQEFYAVQAARPDLSGPDGLEGFSIRANAASREVVAVLEIEEGSSLELAVKLPPASPLRPAEAECRRRVGVTEQKLRWWLLSITSFLRTQNGSVAEAIALWQRNIGKAFKGVEECLICYAVIAPSNGQLPKLKCRTCLRRFHGACLYKWFQSSGKSNCPHCQSPW
ncbi:hypothetical protein WJX74_000343 [Apatococcus lobatus]|uniref:E3 ubiquitin-protein ligase listerin n=1 Tax=Apatococcus lobatus TaxID=904363 RepID=A0AAW1SD99_9CHLO